MSAFTGHSPWERRRGMRWRTPMLASMLGVLFLAFGAASALAVPPIAVTDPATNLSPVGATLNGRVDPRGQATSTYFQYGLTKSYGKKTPAQSAGLAPGFIAVAANITGLASDKTYHFRIVAESKDGKRMGADRTLKTLKPTTTPVFTPNPVPYGDPVAVSGVIVGSGASGAQVSLFGRAFPFTDPLIQFGNTVIADSQGTYLFILSSALSTAQFEVRAKTNPAFTSAIQTLQVSSKISLHAPGSLRKGHKAHFWGIVSPAQDGIVVQIQKLRKGGAFTTFATTTLRHRPDGASSYSVRRYPRGSGTFRAVVLSAGGAWQPGTTNTQFVRVRRR
jgi:hypothetical protein